MKPVVLFLLICFAGTAALPLCSNVDLIALKKQEDERRKKIAKSKVTVTDANVNSISVGGKRYGFVQMESEEPPAEEAAGSPAAKKKENPERERENWKKQQDDLQGRIDGLKLDIENSQQELSRLWSDFYMKSVPAEQEAIRVQIAQITNQMEQKKVFLRQAEEQLEALAERARKAGIPPGWLR